MCRQILKLILSALACALTFSQQGMAVEGVHEGILEPYIEVAVASSEAGIVDSLAVTIGQRVERGDVIGQLKLGDLREQLAVAQAESNSEGRMKQIRTEIGLQRQRVEIINELFINKQANPQEKRRAETDLAIAMAKLDAEIENGHVLKLQVARLKKLIDNHTVRAPLSGVVVGIDKHPGEYVAANSPGLVRIQDISKLRATFPLDEQSISDLAVGQVLPIQLSDQTRTVGKIEYIPPVADPESGWFMISVLIDNSDFSLRSSRCVLIQSE